MFVRVRTQCGLCPLFKKNKVLHRLKKWSQNHTWPSFPLSNSHYVIVLITAPVDIHVPLFNDGAVIFVAGGMQW